MNFIGVEGLKYQIIKKDDDTGVAYEGDIKEIDGVVKIAVEPSSNEATFYGSNRACESVKRLGDIKVALETASLPMETLADFFGHKYDKANNKMACNANDSAPYISIMYTRNKADGTLRHIKLLKVIFGLNKDEATTQGDSVEFQGDAVEGTALPTKFDGNWKDMIETTDTNSAEVEKFLSAFYPEE